MQGAKTGPNADLARQREVVDAFLAALRSGDFEGLLAVLDPDVVVHADDAVVASGGSREVRGARVWASQAIAFSRHARVMQPALVDGSVGVVWAPHGRLARVLRFTMARGRIAQIEVVADPTRLGEIDLAVLDD